MARWRAAPRAFCVRFLFDTFVLDIARRELREGGRAIAVEPQVFDLLEYLVRHRDRVVSRDDLIASIWGGRIVSESTLATRINAARRAIGDDGTAQRLIKTVARKGFRFTGDVREESGVRPDAALPAAEARAQSITFCRTSDAVTIAVATAGEGPTLLKTANWLNHLEYDWQSPIWSPMLKRLAGRFHLIRYDGRGNGLGDRKAADISFAGFERDLEAVIEALGLKRFALFGLSQGAATAITYAVRHPERVSRLILYGGYAQGRNKRGSADDAATAQTVLAMMRQGWGHEDSAFMRAFSSIYLPNGSREQIRWFADMQRLATSGPMAVRLRIACDDIDIVEFLPRVAVPTLVLHARRDHVVPIEQGRLIAAQIPGARFVTLESENHVPVPGEPAWETLLAEIEAFAAASR
jgi:DNA-binding winged helix-turn-helix (wHTH) protein/alpha-beta hydrolase superfamily lysophospholipase